MLVGYLLSSTLKVKALKNMIFVAHRAKYNNVFHKFMPRRGPFYFHTRAKVIGMKKVTAN